LLLAIVLLADTVFFSHLSLHLSSRCVVFYGCKGGAVNISTAGSGFSRTNWLQFQPDQIDLGMLTIITRALDHHRVRDRDRPTPARRIGAHHVQPKYT